MSATWVLLDDDGRCWGAIVGGDIVRVELSRIDQHLGPDGVHTLDGVENAVTLLQRQLSGLLVKEISIGAAGFGFDQLGSARDIPILIEPRASR